ncbi:MAG: hypothetical protein AAF211_20855 [Myxococcota bacterium]
MNDEVGGSEAPCSQRACTVGDRLERLPCTYAVASEARLDVRFGIDEDRWLTATVTDLRTQRSLMVREPVVRLL